ncbi:MAG: hypothetical protein K2G20_01685, partial [Lachnospiraceae bacterium]|nr:hypothetical protein [Lachnospiraceae bacterium]
MKKTGLRMLTVVLVGILLLSGCGKEKTKKSLLSLAIVDVLRVKYPVAKEAAMAAKADIEGARLAIEEIFFGKDRNCQYIF